MPCCGSQRTQFTGSYGGQAPERNLFQYVGKAALTVAGPVSERQYRFSAPGATVEADARDAPSLAQVPLLRRV
jgi:hypothetical protein